MASKKLKKAIVAGLAGVAGAKMLGQANQMKTYLAEEGGDRAKVNYITKKTKAPIKKTFMGKVKDATKKVVKENINLGRGPNIKPTDSLAGNYKGAFDYFDIDLKSKGGQTIKARGGKMINMKPTKLY